MLEPTLLNVGTKHCGARFAFLETHPLVGRERRDLSHDGIRSWRIKDFERWLIFYAVRDDAIVFYRVASGTMDLFNLRFE